MITCRTFVEFLLDYQSGTLPDGQRDEFDLHLAACTACVNYMNSYMETIRLGKAAYPGPDEPAPVDAPEELVQAILHARRAGG